MNINEENAKLQNVIKSCKAAKVCSKIILILFMVATVLTLVVGIVFIADQKNMDAKIKEGLANSNIKKELSVGSIKVGSIDGDDIEFAKGMELESSVPALQKYFTDNSDSYALLLGFYCIFAAILCAILTFAMWMILSVFNTIIKEGNPFADSVPRRILISMVTLTVLVAITTGIGFAVLLGLTTWAVYTVVDYGKQLRIQSDETL